MSDTTDAAAKAKAAEAKAKADAAELTELRAYKAQADAKAAAAATAAPEGTTRYVHSETGEERDFTPETYDLLAPDFAGYVVKPEKPAPLGK